MLPWTRVAETQGWLDQTSDVPERILVDIWPALARNGVRPFEVTDHDTPMDVLARASSLLEMRCPKAHFWLATDDHGKARVHASIEVFSRGMDLSWLLLDGVESLRWTCPRVFPVVLRACAVLWHRCNLGDGWLWQFAEMMDWEEEDREEDCAGIAEALGHGQKTLIQEMKRLDRYADPAVLLEEAERLGPGWFEVQDMAANVATAVDLVGNIWQVPSLEEWAGSHWQEMFQVFFSHPVFLGWMEQGFNDYANADGISEVASMCRLSRFGRSGSLDAMRAGAERLEKGLDALEKAVAAINEITGVFDDWDEWYAEVEEQRPW